MQDILFIFHHVESGSKYLRDGPGAPGGCIHEDPDGPGLGQDLIEKGGLMAKIKEEKKCSK